MYWSLSTFCTWVKGQLHVCHWKYKMCAPRSKSNCTQVLVQFVLEHSYKCFVRLEKHNLYLLSGTTACTPESVHRLPPNTNKYIVRLYAYNLNHGPSTIQLCANASKCCTLIGVQLELYFYRSTIKRKILWVYTLDAAQLRDQTVMQPLIRHTNAHLHGH